MGSSRKKKPTEIRRDAKLGAAVQTKTSDGKTGCRPPESQDEFTRARPSHRSWVFFLRGELISETAL